jgi:cell division protein FtsQ
MWDDVQALSKLTNMLLGVSLLLVLFASVHYAVHLPVFALRAVWLESVPQRADVTLIADVVHNDLSGNFFTLDLERTRKTFEKVPWVRKAIVRRQFPWQLDVALEEQVALASWNGVDLVNVQGEVFSAEPSKSVGLPAFIGPEGSSAEMAQYYARFGSILAPLKQEIALISLSPRGAWQLRLRSGLLLELGRDQTEERLGRFVAAYPTSVAAMRQPVNYVDLRYRNGFAARAAG